MRAAATSLLNTRYSAFADAEEVGPGYASIGAGLPATRSRPNRRAMAEGSQIAVTVIFLKPSENADTA